MNDDNEPAHIFSQKEAKNLIEKYTDSLPLRLIIQNIPYMGASSDTILSETGSKWRKECFQTLLQSLDEEITAVNITNNKMILECSKEQKQKNFIINMNF
jgi:hypothetical protein